MRIIAMRPQIINIINFIRAVEPREPVDLLTPVKKQAELMQKHKLRGTFLLQYDALISPEYTDFLKSLDPAQFEFGVWFEVVQPLCEAVGETWTGRFSWDWHAQHDLPQGYAPKARIKMTDCLFGKFKEVFGSYPRVMGAWVLDTICINHAAGQYGLDALCCCKEQFGTDGYTLWGGYYGQGYYPSKKNFFVPAATKENQLSVPIFRMLGSDPVYQYDFGRNVDGQYDTMQGVITLEPASGNGGCNPAWVDWYLRENFNGECLSFGYAQAGQENSFGWEGMASGLEYQFRRFEELSRQGKLEILTLSETGRRFSAAYEITPASAISAHTAWDDPGKCSFWYSSRYYRINVFSDENGIRIRDIYTFHEDSADPYLTKICNTDDIIYETDRVLDGNRQSGNGVLAGVYPLCARTGEPFHGNDYVFTDLGNGVCEIAFDALVFSFTPESCSVRHPDGVKLKKAVGRESEMPDADCPVRAVPYCSRTGL